MKDLPEKLYHGTCKAFVAYALQNEGKLGPCSDSVSFTPKLDHARMFSESWKTPAGLKKLEDCFGEVLDLKFSEPVVLEFDSSTLGKLHYRKDCEIDEFYVECGPIDISLGKEVS